MIEEILPDFFRVTVPLPDSPLGSTNVYLIRSSGRSLMIYTGFDHPDSHKTVITAMNSLRIDRNRTDFLITHMHQDHIGLLQRLASSTSIVYFNQKETEFLRGWRGFESISSYVQRNGFPEKQLRKAARHWQSWDGNTEQLRFLHFPLLSSIKDGQIVKAGEYRFKCILTPGHSPGHTCLYEPDTKILVSGDHILEDISPNIACSSEDEEPLSEYMESLRNVQTLEVERVLPGHRRPFTDHRKRILEILEHHQVQLLDVLNILNGSRMNAYQVAARMTWSIEADSWDNFPVVQQLFATAECLAHLRYLEVKGVIRRSDEDGTIRFSLASIDPCGTS